MKKAVCIVIIFLIAITLNAQSTTENLAKIAEIQQQVKNIQENVKQLNKAAIDKKIAFNKEKDIANKAVLQNEINSLKQQVKLKNEEIANLKKQEKDLQKLNAKLIVNPKIVLNKNITIGNVNPKLLNDSNYYIEIFEKFNYQGKSFRVYKNTDIKTVLFDLENSRTEAEQISIKKSPGFFKATVNGLYRNNIVIEKDEPEIRFLLTSVESITIDELPSIQIFEHPNYTGRSLKLLDVKQIKDIVFPFQSSNISIKFSNEDKIILYLSEKGNNDFKILLNSEPNLSISTQNIESVYLGNKVKIEVAFNGILLNEIHNNDCKRMYGVINYNLIENVTNASFRRMNPIKTKNIDRSFDNNLRYNVFRAIQDNNEVCPFAYKVCNYCAPANGYPLVKVIDRRRGRGNADGQSYLQTAANTVGAKQYFYIDSGALFTPKGISSLSMEVSTTLGSAHKSCDLCNDFTWDAKMNEAVTESKSTHEYIVLGNKAVALFQFGPYRKHPQGYQRLRPNDIYKLAVNNFSGPEHETYIQFSIKIVN